MSLNRIEKGENSLKKKEGKKRKEDMKKDMKR